MAQVEGDGGSSGSSLDRLESDLVGDTTSPRPPGPLNTVAPGFITVNGIQVHVNEKGIIDTKGPWYGKYPQEVAQTGAKVEAAPGTSGGVGTTAAPTTGGAPTAAPAPSSNTSSGPVAPAPSTATPANSAVDNEVRRMFGDVAAFLSHPELGPILRKAAAEGWDQSRLFGALQQTKFWKSEGESARKWAIQKTLDPATVRANIDAQTANIAEMTRQWGLSYNADQLRYFAELSLKNGWTGPQIREHLFARESRDAAKTGALDTNIEQQYGYLAAFLDEPEVGDLLRRAAREGWTEQRLEVELRKTEFWQTTTDSQRRWDAMREQNPADAKAQRDNRAQEITALASSLGVRLDPARLGEIADASMRFGWSQTQLRNAVAREYEFGERETSERMSPRDRRRGRGPAGRAGVDPQQQGEFGLAAQTAREVKAMAAQYLVPISPQTLEKWTEQVVRGENDMEGFNAYLVQQAKSLFPGMADALDRGITVAQYADPYKQIAARELEIAPESIDLNDPRYRRMLDQVDQKGNRVPMTLSQASEYLRKQPEWQRTRGANEKAATLTESILKSFGKVA